MDIHMPGESGTDVAFALEARSQTENLRIAFLTNLKEPWPAISGSMDKVAKELGMEDFLEKTDDLDNLVRKSLRSLVIPKRKWSYAQGAT